MSGYLATKLKEEEQSRGLLLFLIKIKKKKMDQLDEVIALYKR